MTSEYFPELTIRYKTYAKRTLVESINTVFQNHPDDLLQRTRATIEYPKTEADYPSIVVRFYERQVFNAGVGHQEILAFNGESDSIEVQASLSELGAVTLNWAPITSAYAYKIYKGTTSDAENQSFTVSAPTFTDRGDQGAREASPTVVTAQVDTPQPTAVTSPDGLLAPGDYFYRVTAIEPAQAVKFQHYFYNADIEFAVYALSAYDRDLIADSLVQMIAMGRLEAYTNSFFERIYPSNDLYPDSHLHFININSDEIQGFGESQAETVWGAEDDLMYLTSYRVGVFGELYSLPPKLTYAMVHQVFVLPYITNVDPIPEVAGDSGPWISNSVGSFP